MKWSEWSGQCKNVEAEDGRVFNLALGSSFNERVYLSAT